MGLFDHSTSNANVTNETENTNAPVNVQDSGGAQVFENKGDVNNYTMLTDYNAIDDATQLAQKSVDAATYLGDNAQQLSLKTSQLVADVLQSSQEDSQALIAKNTAGTIDAITETTRNALDATIAAQGGARQAESDALQTVAENSRSNLNTVIDFVGGIQSKFQDTISSTVDALQKIGKEQNTSTDQRLADTTTTITKYAIVGVAVVVLGLVLMNRRMRA
jgi:hypothetical protein